MSLAIAAVFQLTKTFEGAIEFEVDQTTTSIRIRHPDIPRGHPIHMPKIDIESIAWLITDASDEAVAGFLSLPKWSAQGIPPKTFHVPFKFDADKELSDLPIEDWILQSPSEDHRYDHSGLGQGLMWHCVGAFASLKAELLALQTALQVCGELLRGLTVVWITDSLCSIFAIMKGGSGSLARRLVNMITTFCHDLDICLIPRWTSRDLIQSADAATKLHKNQHFCFAPDMFLPLAKYLRWNYKFSPSIDVFASCKNALCAKYISRAPEPDAWALDAFTIEGFQYDKDIWCYPTWSEFTLKRLPLCILRWNCGIALLLPAWAHTCRREVEEIASQGARWVAILTLPQSCKWLAVDDLNAISLRRPAGTNAILYILTYRGNGHRVKPAAKQLNLEPTPIHLSGMATTEGEYPHSFKIAMRRRFEMARQGNIRALTHGKSPRGGDALPIISGHNGWHSNHQTPNEDVAPLMGVDTHQKALRPLKLPKRKRNKRGPRI